MGYFVAHLKDAMEEHVEDCKVNGDPYKKEYAKNWRDSTEHHNREHDAYTFNIDVERDEIEECFKGAGELV